MSFEEDRARDRVREAANAGYLSNWAAARERFEQATREWEAAAREYRDAYHRIADRNPLLDEFGLTTGEVAPLGARDQAVLDAAEHLEAQAWARRQAAATAFERADDFSHPW
ncbi:MULTISPECIES: hypothetical protein [unclassified Nocardioides]|uniref:hypothetical protein n=1 Tax=unclassified Nocardioides TaxID=2615069 RepID=UPI000057098D|nr:MULTISPECIES: hypothetical protein [unclassified Nocardioides]ABL80094.1 hypothetical protein Noca_0552 [Nocardioides sp. JS614]